ncbi:hypothetical protein Bca52824_010158 [Brassica carinata]|uniref:Protein kinase domain-containing protein n=1 Tax=Brassica carinata TaxID=52824 RepID=A0A8X8B9V6_BRACI|nr:hypothetical protein Bca52824_010158 [Brassica carinata]
MFDNIHFPLKKKKERALWIRSMVEPVLFNWYCCFYFNRFCRFFTFLNTSLLWFPGPLKKQSLSRKLLLVTLIFCVAVTSVAFLASMFYYIYRRTSNVSGQSPSVSSDRESSWHSSSNLIISITSSLSGCFFQNASLFCVSKPETIHGMIFQFSYGELEQATNKFSSNNCLSSDGLQSGSSSPTMGLQGTFGYFAPEYAIAGCASPMSDVFSFGVVLLELITGRKPIQKPSNNKGEESLVIWAMQRLQDSKRVIEELPDPRLSGKFAEEEMQIMAYLAKECLLLEPEARPTMREVVQILSTIMPDTSRRRNFPINHLFRKVGWSRGGSRTAKEEESVDLTEPRFESFCLPNVKPVLLEPSAHI